MIVTTNRTYVAVRTWGKGLLDKQLTHQRRELLDLPKNWTEARFSGVSFGVDHAVLAR
jgi:hypothetical protein